MTGRLWQAMHDSLRQHHDRPAVGSAGAQVSYAELDEQSAALQRRIATHTAGLRPRPRIALFAGNGIGYVTAFLAILRDGGVPLLFDPGWGAVELNAAIRSCGVDLVLHDRALTGVPSRVLAETADAMTVSEPLERVEGPEMAPDTEVCRYTSGTTGFANCIEFAGSAVLGAAAGWREGTGLSSEDRILCFAGLSNGLAFNTSLNPGLLAGSLLVLPAGLPTSGQVARFLTECEPSLLTGFPALYSSLLRRTGELPGLSRLRVALSSGAPLPAADAVELRERHGLAIANYYGVAEVGPLTFDPEPAPERGLGSPLPGVVFDLGDAADDEQPRPIAVRSQSMGTRYLNAPGVFEAKLDAAGFYRTGDEGFLREGRLHLAGRSGKAVNVGGRKIDPREVEAVLTGVPGVTAAAVVAVTKRNGDAALGAVVAASDAVSADALRAHCRSVLADYKVPERLVVVEALPLTAIGKPRLTAVRELLGDTVLPTASAS